MKCFEVLGIEPTDEIKKIKRAYAAKTKECHPEEHPEEFSVLHDAYEEAMYLAKMPKDAGAAEWAEEPVQMPQAEKPWQDGDEWEAAFRQIVQNTREHGNISGAVRQIIEKCQTLYINEAERNKLYHWKDILEEPEYASLLMTKEFVTAWYEFLTSHHMFPIPIWAYFDSKDGVLFSGEPFGVARFPYQIYLDPYFPEPEPVPVPQKKKIPPVLKRILYVAAAAALGIVGFVAGVVAGTIFG